VPVASPPAKEDDVSEAELGTRRGAAETAARHLVRRVPTAPASESAGGVLARLSGQRFDCADGVCVLAGDGSLDAWLPLDELFAAPPGAKLGELGIRPAPAVTPDVDQESVASFALLRGVSAVPVVGRDGALLGVVPAAALLEVLRHEHVEDLHRLAGIRHDSSLAREALEAPPLRRVRDRLPWLLAGLAGSSMAAYLVARFEATLQARLAIAFFVPGIVYLADAIGTQTEAIVVRGLSLSSGPRGRLLLGELLTGIALGLLLGGLSGLAVWLWLGDFRLASAVTLALIGAGAVATTIGFALPWALSRWGGDPAFGSGPLATVIQDVLSLLIYFATVSALVG
jgi:magnesium transporter